MQPIKHKYLSCNKIQTNSIRYLCNLFKKRQKERFCETARSRAVLGRAGLFLCASMRPFFLCWLFPALAVFLLQGLALWLHYFIHLSLIMFLCFVPPAAESLRSFKTEVHSGPNASATKAQGPFHHWDGCLNHQSRGKTLPQVLTGSKI